MKLPAFIPSTQQLAASRAGRLVLTFAIGAAARQLVTQVRNLVAMADALDNPPTAADRAAVVDVEPPTPAPEGDPLPESEPADVEPSPSAVD